MSGENPLPDFYSLNPFVYLFYMHAQTEARLISHQTQYIEN